MRAHWEAGELRRINMGTLVFLHTQGKRMHARIASRRMLLVSSTESSGVTELYTPFRRHSPLGVGPLCAICNSGQETNSYGVVASRTAQFYFSRARNRAD
jgi:hypothetical protein